MAHGSPAKISRKYLSMPEVKKKPNSSRSGESKKPSRKENKNIVERGYQQRFQGPRRIKASIPFEPGRSTHYHQTRRGATGSIEENKWGIVNPYNRLRGKVNRK